jgi:hypothetical protein
MSASFEAEVANNLRTIQSAVTALSARYTDLERRGTSAASKVAAELRKVGQSADQADRKAMSLQQRIQRLAAAGGKLGGPIGEGFGRMVGGFGMGGAAGIGAGALGGLAVIGRVIGNIDRENLEHTREVVRLSQRRAQIERDAASTRRQQGVSAVQSQGDSLKLLMSRGDLDAVEWANRVANSGVATTANAQAGVAQAFSLPGMHHKEAVMEAAYRVAATGEMDFAQAAQAASDPAMLARILRTGGVNDVASRLMVQARGQHLTPKNLTNARNDLDRTLNSTGDLFLGGILSTQSKLNQVDQEGQRAILRGQATAGASEMLAQAVDPASAALLEVNREHNQKLEELSTLAKEQLTVVKWFRDSWFNRFVIGGERSEASKVNRAHEVYGAD